MREPFESMDHWLRKGRRFAFAELVATGEGGPRDPGACMAVSERGDIAGSVSGGCVEGAVVAAALEVIETGEAVELAFGAAEAGVHTSEAARSRAAEPAFAPAAPALPVLDYGEISTCAARFRVRVLPFGEEVRARMREARGEVRPRLVCVGAVHIAASLVRLAREVGYETVVVDPRAAFTGADRFAEADEVLTAWPQDALPALGLGSRDAVCALSHDEKIDVPALACALESDAFYLGCLGHAETLADRRTALLARGCAPASLARIYGPIGVWIGGREPEEIALSALAQIQAVRYGRIGHAREMPGRTLDFFTPECVARIAEARPAWGDGAYQAAEAPESEEALPCA